MFAMAACQVTVMFKLPALSRAGSLPQDGVVVVPPQKPPNHPRPIRKNHLHPPSKPQFPNPSLT